MVKTPRPIPDHQDLAELIHAALTNARDLLDGAEVLLTAGLWPLAYSVATLSFEEVGKAQHCLTAMVAPEPARQGLDFWGMFTGHHTKISMAHLMHSQLASGQEPRQSVAETMSNLAQLANVDNTTKFRGLYVDFKDGVVLRPSGINEDDARRMVNSVRACLEFAEPLREHVRDPVFGDYVQAQRDAFADRIPAIVAAVEEDSDAFMAAIRDGFQAAREGREPEWPDVLEGTSTVE